MVSIFSGFRFIPVDVKMWPKNLTSDLKKCHFSKLMVRLFSQSLGKRSSKCCKCWLMFSEEQKMSSINVTQKFPKPLSTESRALTRAAVVVLKPKGVTQNS